MPSVVPDCILMLSCAATDINVPGAGRRSEVTAISGSGAKMDMGRRVFGTGVAGYSATRLSNFDIMRGVENMPHPSAPTTACTT